MAEKQITNNELAIMIKNGFDNTATKQQFESLEKRVGSLENEMADVKKDLKYVKENIKSTAELEKEVDYIKNTLSIPAIKK